MTNVLAPGLARKVKKILETRTDSSEILGSMETLSSFYTENTVTARRRLRSTIEKQSLNINLQYLAAAESVIQALDVVQGDLDSLSLACRRINSALATSRTATADMLADTEKLTRDLAVSEHRSQLVTKFLQQYQLSESEVVALQGGEVSPAFFAALERVRAIHANCRTLLRTHHQRAGLELMDAMAAHQETAYERLCRWVQGECRGLGELDAPEVDPRVQQAVRALQERPVLFRCCAEEVATARHNALFQRFIAALTRGGPGGMPRPIEMHAHDPRRYIGDMLAWVHQSLASERELLVSLFGEDGLQPMASGPLLSSGSGGVGAVTSPREGLGGAGGLGPAGEALNTAVLLDRVFESICRPLKVRIEQVLLSSPPPLLCFKLALLLRFYCGTVASLLGGAAQLTGALEGCAAQAGRAFLDALRARGDRLLRYPPPPPPDLSPPPQVVETLQQLLEIVAEFEAAQEGGAGEEGDLAPVLSTLLDPLLAACERSAEALSAQAPTRVDDGRQLEPGARATYLLNCLAAVHGALSRHACCAAPAASVAAAVEGQLAGLVAAEMAGLLGRCGMAEVLGRMRLYQEGSGQPAEGAVMATDPALPAGRVAGALRDFFALLSRPDALPEFRNLQVPRLKAEASARIARGLAESYAAVYGALRDPRNGYPEDAEAVRHTPLQVRTILSVS